MAIRYTFAGLDELIEWMSTQATEKFDASSRSKKIKDARWLRAEASVYAELAVMLRQSRVGSEEASEVCS